LLNVASGSDRQSLSYHIRQAEEQAMASERWIVMCSIV